MVWIQDVDEEDGVIPGVDGFEFITALNPMAVERAYDVISFGALRKFMENC